MSKRTQGWILAAPASNSGKTLVAAALLRLMARKGMSITPFKVGPDYIDPGFLSNAADKTCFNLDPWAMNSARIEHLLCNQSGTHFLIEGVMGLFDGAVSGDGSTADLATALNLPVVMVINAKGQGASVAALAQGFINHRKDVHVAGVIFTHIGSDRHKKIVSDACDKSQIRVFGYLKSDPALSLRERHLGLVQASESDDLEQLLDRAADSLGESLNFLDFLELATSPSLNSKSTVSPIPPLGQNIAVAHDIAFGFCYPHVLEDWKASGAQISFFSPLANEAPALDSDAVYLPGGYPELHATALAANNTFLQGLRDAANRDAVILGECGGYMVLGQGVEDADGNRHAMAGLLELETSFAKRKLHLGYRKVELQTGCCLGETGTKFRAHEFHYTSILREEGNNLFTVSDALGENKEHAGLVSGKIMGSFIHLIDRS
ncbi:MAG: cobyrinate a,c-diamide synthase [Rhodospirillales bacterium]|jgi:cobyrinic acid a,c-diamide synthase|nr:cobyrinate a,c-diamide synthase [Rhodospirillales bacterium]